MLLWLRLVCGGTAVPRSSPGPRLPKPYGRRPLAAPGALLVSPFNVKWRFSAPAGDVEESKFCLFSVIMPAKCVSSVSPRFHYRRLAFCFLPLAAILEFLTKFSLNNFGVSPSASVSKSSQHLRSSSVIFSSKWNKTKQTKISQVQMQYSFTYSFSIQS
jgi:hypothetical protein